MSAIDEKLDQCRIGVEDIKEIRAVQDVPKLLTRFTGYVNNVSALRQYVQNELRGPLRSKTPNDAQRWLDALETDQDIAGVMGLRHIDQHKTLVRVHRRAAKFGITEYTVSTSRADVMYSAISSAGTIWPYRMRCCRKAEASATSGKAATTSRSSA